MKSNKKEFSLSTFISRAFIYPAIILLIVLQLLNVGVYLQLPEIITRYIPTAIMGFVCTFFVYKSGIKKLHRSDAKTVKTVGFIAPIVVAIALALYGLYSVNSNIKEAEKKLNNNYSYSISLYKSVYGEEEYQKQVKDQIEIAKNSAIKMWIISAILYAVTGEIGAVLSLKSLEDKMLPDSNNNNDYNLNNMNLGASPSYNSELGDNPIDNSPPQEAGTNNINWNL